MTGDIVSKKLIVIGEIGVGKTSLVRRFVLDEFSFDYRPTMGVDIYRYRVAGLGESRSQTVELVIWDIDGHYGQSVFKHVYCRGSSGALIVGDLTRYPTLELMVDLARGFEETLPGRFSAFVLNKTDACSIRAEDMALPAGVRDAELPRIYTSALNGGGVVSTFRSAAESILRREA